MRWKKLVLSYRSLLSIDIVYSVSHGYEVHLQFTSPP